MSWAPARRRARLVVGIALALVLCAAAVPGFFYLRYLSYDDAPIHGAPDACTLLDSPTHKALGGDQPGQLTIDTSDNAAPAATCRWMNAATGTRVAVTVKAFEQDWDTEGVEAARLWFNGQRGPVVGSDTYAYELAINKGFDSVRTELTSDRSIHHWAHGWIDNAVVTLDVTQPPQAQDAVPVDGARLAAAAYAFDRTVEILGVEVMTNLRKPHE